MAGKRKGTDDERYLWGEMLRAIQEIKPTYVIAENVFGITNIDGGLVFEQVCLDLEAEGYEVQPFIIPAAAKNAPHRRDRCWFIAQKTLFSGCLHRESEQERTEVWQQRNTCTGSTERIHLSEGNAANTKSFDSRGEFRNLAKENGQESREWVGNNTTKSSHISDERNATDTNSNGLNERNRNDEKQPSQRGEYALGDLDTITMHTNCTMREGQHIGQKREGESNGSNSRDGINYFQNFPTQSPICSGDDGLPSKLDGITFSKWRAESIKGYGNAIVPQVALELFKIIETI